MQLTDQPAVQLGRKGFLPGRSGNPRGRTTAAEKRAHILALARQYAEPIGGLDSIPAVERELLLRAAELAQYRPQRFDQRLRAANIINRIIRDVLRRHKPAKVKTALRERLTAEQSA
jgi:hypothetical protein